MNKKELLKQIEILKTVPSVRNMDSVIESLRTVEERLNDESFKIAVVGEFSAGKSTFINAILGKDVLSHSIEETTATVTYIHNVPACHKLINTCRINYRSGKIVQFDDFSKISEYTTAQSENRVSEEILNVEIYVRFLDVDLPLMIVDTPGLNGVADNHREITIEEIQKAHLCVYLLPLKGISKSDIEFIKVLLQYQSNFIFIQNFKDSIKIDEGETPDDKVNEISNILNTELIEKGYKFNFYEPICLSALMALVAKDENIPRLYNGSDILSLDDRKILLENSNFNNFEKELESLMNSGEYKNAIINSAIQTLNKIIEFLLEILKSNNSEIQDLIEADPKNSKLHTLVDKIKSNESKDKKKLEDFITAKKVDSVAICREKIARSVEELNMIISKQIDDDIKTYDDISNFNVKYGKTIKAKYNEECNKLAQNIRTDIDLKTASIIQQIYVLAILQIRKYTDIQNLESSEKFRINIEMTNVDNEIHNRINFKDQREKIDDKIQEIAKKTSEMNGLINESSNTNDEITLKRQLSEENNRYKLKSEQIVNRQKQLGVKPKYKEEKITEQRKVEVYRGGLGVMDKIFGPKIKYENYTTTITNLDEIAEWEKANNEIICSKNAEDEMHRKKIDDIHRKMDTLEKMKQRNISQAKRIETEIERLKREIATEKDNLNFIEKRAKSELTNSIKNELKRILKRECEIIEEKLIDYMKCIFELNIERMIRLVRISFEKTIKDKIQEINTVISGNVEELQKKCELQVADIITIEKVSKFINDSNGGIQK